MECEEEAQEEGAFMGHDEGLDPEGEHLGADEFEDDAEGDEEEIYLADDYEHAIEEDAIENDIFVALSQDTTQEDTEYHDSLHEVHEAFIAWKVARKRLDSLRKAPGFVPARTVEKKVRRLRGFSWQRQRGAQKESETKI